MKKQLALTLLFCLFMTACGSAPPQGPVETSPAATQPAQIANPASQNCIDQGGTLQIEERGDGGQYGICYFEDNRQCEEWALLNGACPVGGVKVTGYITPAAQYCAITGGTYAITAAESRPRASRAPAPSRTARSAMPGITTTASAPAPPRRLTAGEWVSYTNAEAGFSLQMPSNWSHGQLLPDQNEGTVHGVVSLARKAAWRSTGAMGLGGACPTETVPVQLAQAEVQACHGTKPDQTEYWSQMGYQVSGGNDFSSRSPIPKTPHLPRRQPGYPGAGYPHLHATGNHRSQHRTAEHGSLRRAGPGHGARPGCAGGHPIGSAAQRPGNGPCRHWLP